MTASSFKPLVKLSLMTFSCLFFNSFTILGQDGGDPLNLDEELAFLQEEGFVVTASRVKEDINKTPASVTVFTAREIRNMGVRTLSELLVLVPGLGVTQNSLGFAEIEARGIKTLATEKILLMINSHTVNGILTGTGMVLYDDLALDYVERVEVVRGPGSALYGANAFLAVINVFTKKGEKLDGGVLSLKGGSYETGQASLIYGKKWQEWSVFISANSMETEGQDGEVPMDAQFFLDQLLGTTASLAPGQVREWEDKTDIHLRIDRGPFFFEGKFLDKNKGSYAGIEFALNDGSHLHNDGHYMLLGYEQNYSDSLSVAAKIYRNQYYFNPLYQGYPEGTVLPVFDPELGTPIGLVLREDGLIAEPSAKSRRDGLELQVVNHLGSYSRLVFGGTMEFQELFEAHYLTNFLPLNNAPLPEIMDISDQYNWIRNEEREFWAAFAEYHYEPNESFRVTAGGRYDRYSDFGGSFNPRLGISWRFAPSFTLKGLYGEAFRAPAFTELYTINNPALIANPNLNPEEVTTYEVGITGEFGAHLTASMVYYRNDIDDLIDLSTPALSGTRFYQNVSGIKAKGFEAEMRMRIHLASYVGFFWNQSSADIKETGAPFPDTPSKRGALYGNMAFPIGISLYGDLFYRGKSDRAIGDPRPAHEDFLVANLKMRYATAGLKTLDFGLGVRNLFDEDYSSPSNSASIPFDFPSPGRVFFLEVNWEF